MKYPERGLGGFAAQQTASRGRNGTDNDYLSVHSFPGSPIEAKNGKVLLLAGRERSPHVYSAKRDRVPTICVSVEKPQIGLNRWM